MCGGFGAVSKGKFLSYLRVSADKQGRSGLGLEAQREAVSSYLNGGKWTLVQEYVETESGRRSDRPKLAAALAHAKAIGATIVFAKLDRLSIELLVQNYLTAERNLVAAVDAAGGAIDLPDGRTVTTARAEFDSALTGRRKRVWLILRKNALMPARR